MLKGHTPFALFSFKSRWLLCSVHNSLLYIGKQCKPYETTHPPWTQAEFRCLSALFLELQKNLSQTLVPSFPGDMSSGTCKYFGNSQTHQGVRLKVEFFSPYVSAKGM